MVGNEHISDGTGEIDTDHNVNQGSLLHTISIYPHILKMTCLQLTMRELETWKRRRSKWERGPHLQ